MLSALREIFPLDLDLEPRESRCRVQGMYRPPELLRSAKQGHVELERWLDLPLEDPEATLLVGEDTYPRDIESEERMLPS